MAKKAETINQDGEKEASNERVLSDGSIGTEGVSSAVVDPKILAGFVAVGEHSRAKIVRRITIPTITLDVDSPEAIAQNRTKITICARVVEAIHTGRAIKQGAITTPAKLLTLENEDGAVVKIVVSAVLERELAAAYPNDSYVGCWFLISKFRRKHEKRYNTFSIDEIEKPERNQPAALAAG